MDIQISSNFERLLFEASGRDAEAVKRWMSGLGQSGAFTIDAAPLAAIRAEFAAGRAGENETAQTIRDVLDGCGYLLDTHTATAIHVARRQPASAAPMIVLSTAHPAKFPAAVEAASGISPALPPRLGDLMERAERFTVLPSSLEIVEDHVRNRTRAGATV